MSCNNKTPAPPNHRILFTILPLVVVVLLLLLPDGCYSFHPVIQMRQRISTKNISFQLQNNKKKNTVIGDFDDFYKDEEKNLFSFQDLTREFYKEVRLRETILPNKNNPTPNSMTDNINKNNKRMKDEIEEEIEKFLQSTDGDIVNDMDEIFFVAANHDMLEHFLENHDRNKISQIMALSGNLAALKWVLQKGCPVDKNTSYFAARSGNLRMMKLLRSFDCPWDEDTCTCAARSGRFQALQWMHAHGCPWNKDTCKAAAKNDDLNMLQWLHDESCPWDEETCSAAALNGNMDMLKWLHNVGCPWNGHTFYCAVFSGNKKMLDWARCKGLNGCM